MFKIKREERPVSDVTFEDLFKQNYVYVVKQIVWIVKNQTIAEELAQKYFYSYTATIGRGLRTYLDG